MAGKPGQALVRLDVGLAERQQPPPRPRRIPFASHLFEQPSELPPRLGPIADQFGEAAQRLHRLGLSSERQVEFAQGLMTGRIVGPDGEDLPPGRDGAGSISDLVQDDRQLLPAADLAGPQVGQGDQVFGRLAGATGPGKQVRQARVGLDGGGLQEQHPTPRSQFVFGRVRAPQEVGEVDPVLGAIAGLPRQGFRIGDGLEPLADLGQPAAQSLQGF